MDDDREQRVIRATVGMLEPAKQFGNVSQLGQVMGYGCNSFHRFKEPYDKRGEAVLQEVSWREPVLKSRVAAEFEHAVCAMAFERRPGAR